jgi:hypothetical protein
MKEWKMFFNVCDGNEVMKKTGRKVLYR